MTSTIITIIVHIGNRQEDEEDHSIGNFLLCSNTTTTTSTTSATNLNHQHHLVLYIFKALQLDQT